ncbi:hypothetical protein [Anaeromyxobacter terrae]|uniref:hypothetical protein n=1 Tax=Anaeromyxobacter terrae TaxID=2925406 RepID=UPI001F581E51|nr:hypothetical protein [Anaeromyxobacter sp. SG22]
MRLMLVLSLLLAPAAASAQVDVPRGKPILLDGRIDAQEWGDAAQLQLGDLARVYVKQSDGFVFVGIQLLNEQNGTVDLYLAPGDGQLHDLHASAKLGERVLQGGAWPEVWRWWNNDGWAASVSRVDSWEPRTFLKEPAREYQISRRRFPGREWRMMLDVMTEARPTWRTTRFPPQASDTDAKGWYVVRLGP